MVKIFIGNSSRLFENYKERWVHEQIMRRRKDGINPCIKVIIKTKSLNLSLVTTNCPGLRRKESELGSKEKEVLDLWNKHMSNKEYKSGSLITFLKKLWHLL